MFKRLKKDIQVVFDRDPAARSVWEVVLCYSGLHAIWFHRLSHKLYLRGWVLLPRMISNFARFVTGIEIHPGATIGEGLFIDHGTGIVIGETAELGKNVTLYQGVTLGGTGKEKGKRHPTIGDNVVVASGAKVLGSFTVGEHAKIGAGSVVLKEVPPYATVVGIPGKIVCMYGEKVRGGEDDVDLRHDQLPDPEGEMLFCMQRHIQLLQEKITKLEKELKK
ncbi:MAG: serine O-acetyltransferase [Selenomonadales bacterium]|nr:serine O-acetyltransferase [Selenomonadales bacterium]